MTEGLIAGGDVLVEIVMDDNPKMSLGPQLAQNLADALMPVASSIGAFAATGGETAAALLSRFGVNGIRLADEIEPGVSLGLTLGALSVPIATKAGAFGDENSLIKIRERLQHRPNSRKLHMTRPTIAITMGDPAGIGPEVIMKAFAHPEMLAMCNPLVIGDANRLRKAGEIVGARIGVDLAQRCKGCEFRVEERPMRGFEDRVRKILPFGQMSPDRGRGGLSLHREGRRDRAGRHRAGYLHRAALQGSTACGRPQISWAYRTARASDRHAGSVDDAGVAEAARDLT